MGKIDAQRIDNSIPDAPDRPLFVLTAAREQTGNLVEFRDPEAVVVLAIRADGKVIGSATTKFADLETPAGVVDGINDTFTLAHSPNPPGSLLLFKNGQLLIPGGEDYTLAGNVIVYVAGAIPQPGDVHKASYRY